MAKGDVKVVALIDENRKQSGAIAFLENNVDPLTGTVTAKARIGNANEGLWPGQFVKVEIILGIEPEAISVPAPAIQLGPQGPYLFVVKDGVAELRPVEIKRTQNGESVIGKGLQPGEQVVVDGQLRLVNGANVTIRPATPESPAAVGAAARLVSGEAGIGDMLSALCIRRPVMTILVMFVFRHRRRLRLQAASRRGRAARRVPDHPGDRPASGRQPRDHGGLGGFDPRAPVLDHRRRDDDDLDVVAGQHLDRPAVRPQPLDRRRRTRRAVGHLLGHAPPAGRAHDAAQLPQGQPGGLRRDVPGA